MSSNVHVQQIKFGFKAYAGLSPVLIRRFIFDSKEIPCPPEGQSNSGLFFLSLLLSTWVVEFIIIPVAFFYCQSAIVMREDFLAYGLFFWYALQTFQKARTWNCYACWLAGVGFKIPSFRRWKWRDNFVVSSSAFYRESAVVGALFHSFRTWLQQCFVKGRWNSLFVMVAYYAHFELLRVTLIHSLIMTYAISTIDHVLLSVPKHSNPWLKKPISLGGRLL